MVFYGPCLHVVSHQIPLFISARSLFHALLLATVKYLLFLWLSRPEYFSLLSLYQYCHEINRKQERSQTVKWPSFY